jgi:hypothetical protein
MMISGDEQLYQARAAIQTRWRFPEAASVDVVLLAVKAWQMRSPA